MKKNLNSTYLEVRPQILQQISSSPQPILFFPSTLPLASYVEKAQEQKHFQVVELSSLDPLGDCLHRMNPLKAQSFSYQPLLEFLRKAEAPFLFVLQTSGEIDFWFSSFLWQLFQKESPHRFWIQGQATALKQLEPVIWQEITASPEDQDHEKQFVQELFKSRKFHPISESEELILTLASIEGTTFSAPMLYRLFREFSAEFPDQDSLEDLLDEKLSFWVEHIGFWQNYFSLYRFRYPAVQTFFQKRARQQFPELESLYHGLFELYLPLKYTSESLFPQPTRSISEQDRFLRYQRFGSFLMEDRFPIEWLPEPWKLLYNRALGQAYREIGKWSKSAKHFSLVQEKIPSLENELLESIRGFRSERNWPEFEKAIQEALQQISDQEDRLRGNLLVELGYLALVKKQPTEALHFFYQAQDSYKRGFHFQELTRVWQHIFDVEFAQESFDKAILVLNQAKKYLVPETPEWFLIYHRLGYFYQMFGEWDLALNYLREAEKNEEKWGPPSEVLEIYTRIAHLLLNQMELLESRYYYKKALALAIQQKKQIRETMILISLTDLCIRLNTLEEAEGYYRQALNYSNILPPEEQKEFHEVIQKPLEIMSSFFRQS